MNCLVNFYVKKVILELQNVSIDDIEGQRRFVSLGCGFGWDRRLYRSCGVVKGGRCFRMWV